MRVIAATSSKCSTSVRVCGSRSITASVNERVSSRARRGARPRPPPARACATRSGASGPRRASATRSAASPSGRRRRSRRRRRTRAVPGANTPGPLSGSHACATEDGEPAKCAAASTIGRHEVALRDDHVEVTRGSSRRRTSTSPSAGLLDVEPAPAIRLRPHGCAPGRSSRRRDVMRPCREPRRTRTRATSRSRSPTSPTGPTTTMSPPARSWTRATRHARCEVGLHAVERRLVRRARPGSRRRPGSRPASTAGSGWPERVTASPANGRWRSSSSSWCSLDTRSRARASPQPSAPARPRLRRDRRRS